MPYPKLSFACELEQAGLEEIFFKPPDRLRTGEALIRDLQELKAQVCLGILDLTPERASVVKKLNEAGIPVVAWLLLPKSQGYWFNLENAPQAVKRYFEWKEWSQRNNLKWSGVGLDIEPSIDEMGVFVSRGMRALPALFPRLASRILRHKQFRTARMTYNDLIDVIHKDGYLVESYQFPFIEDERLVGSTLLQKATGILDLPADKEVWMLYSSFMRPYGAGYLWSYAPQAQAIGIGSTGGGVDLDFGDGKSPLSWDEFARDLRLAWHWTDDIFIFSLEGCVRNGFLSRMRSFLWDQPILFPEQPAERIERTRALLRSALWVSSNITTIFAAFMCTTLGVIAIRRWMQRKFTEKRR